MIAIAVVNLKGGSAKSSTCYHLGGVLAKRGKRVLVVDDDPQSSLTQGFWGPRVLRDLPPGRTIAALYGSDPLPEQIIHPTDITGLSLLPGHEDAMAWNTPIASEWGDASLAIRSLLSEVVGDFDVALIDCPPNLHLCSFAALMAASHVIVPLQAEDFGAQGMVAVNRAIAQVQGQRGGPPSILPPFARESLRLTDEQRKQLDELDADVREKLVKILTPEQKQELEAGIKGGLAKIKQAVANLGREENGWRVATSANCSSILRSPTPADSPRSMSPI